ncbi:MAG: ABC transporter permease [Thermodesulfobacteriota bacterium]
MNNIHVTAGKIRDVLQQAWKALALHRLRSLLSVLGIVFAVAAVVTMMAIAEGAKREALEQIGRLGVDSIIIRNAEAKIEEESSRFAPAPDGLGDKDIRILRRIPEVVRVTVVREINAVLAERGEADVTRTLAVSQDYLAARGLQLARGRFISDSDVKTSQQVCVLGAELAGRITPAAAPGDTVHLDGDPFRVVGILRPRGRADNQTLPLALVDFDNAAFIPLAETTETAGPAGESAAYSEIILKISAARFIAPVSRAVRHALLWSRDGIENFELIVPRELLAQARRTQRLFNIVLGSIAGISLLVGGIGIMNIMLANVSERTREIGIRRAIGASRRHIVIHFLGESILLTVIGGVFGILLGSFAALGVNFFIQWRAAITLWPVLSALFMSAAVGIVSGIYPAVKAARMEPVAALRHV